MSLLHQIALTCIPDVGDITARRLLSYCGSPEEIFKVPKFQLQKIPGIGPKTASRIGDPEAFRRAEQELKFIDQHQIKSYFITEESYPARLKNCEDAPVLFYFKGEANFNTAKVISIVGTRNATNYGRDLCRQFIADLKVYQPLVVSGLAYGIDSMAHLECLKNEIPTIGVLGHGLDRIYPAQNQFLAEKMLSCGGLLSEFTSGTPTRPENFPKRNRIIAGIADVTIVVEASTKGGALITAGIARSYDRDVFAFPGRINDEYSAGCHELILMNRAGLITKASDLEYLLLNWTVDKPVIEQQPSISSIFNLSADEKHIVDLLQEKGKIPIDDLVLLCHDFHTSLPTIMLELEMRGIIVALPGKQYELA